MDKLKGLISGLNDCAFPTCKQYLSGC